VQVGEYGRLKEQLLSQEELQASLSAKAAQLEASQAHVSELELQLAQALEQGTSQSQRLATLQAAADGASRAQAETAVQRQEALASLEVAAAELERVQQQLSVAQVCMAGNSANAGCSAAAP
jgi:chromosome segregation ATPase